MSLAELTQRLGRADDGRFAPRLCAAADGAACATLEQELAHLDGVQVFDTLAAQLTELLETREPARALGAEELARRVARHLGGRPLAEYGTWAYYPWSRRLVHVLPEPEFRELRQSRNRNLITADEQAALARARIGIVGLSVGQATAVTLAMEGVGGELALADFDRLSLSNTNRVRAGVDAVGVNKAVLTAREIAAIDPYARVRVFERGLADDNIEEFLAGVDLLIEECDDLYMKLRLRERAAARRIPVLMETGDRGLLDIERFDREPSRPPLHGLAGALAAERLRDLPMQEKVPIALRIVGEGSISPRLAASLVEIGVTLTTWPQLASSVALGAALNTDAARRIILGELRSSGRFRVDLEQLVSDQAAVSDLDVPSELEPLPEARAARPAPALRTGSRDIDVDDVRALVGYGVMAPSGGNCQPWRFVWRAPRLSCVHDVERSRSFLDFRHSASHLAFGAAVENIALAAAQRGFQVEAPSFPRADDPSLVCELSFTADDAVTADGALFAAIPARVSNRKTGERAALDGRLREALTRAAHERGARLQIVSDAEQLAAIGTVLGAGDRLRMLSPVMHEEMMRELRWTPEEVRRTRDGLDVTTLELTAVERAALRVTASSRAMALVRRVGGGAGLERLSRHAVEAASAMALLTVEGDAPSDFFRAGRALERVWLTASAAGWSVQPMTAITYLFARLSRGGEGLAADEVRELTRLRRLHREVFAVPAGASEPMLLRLTRSEPPTARSLRRAVDEVFRAEPR